MNLADIARALASESVDERRSAVRYLESATELDEPLLDALFVALADEDWRVRRDALDVALAMAGASSVERTIQGILQWERVGFRNACVELAQAMGTLYTQAAKAYVRQAAEASPLLFDGIGAGDGEDVRFLAEYAEGADVNLAAAAIAALSRIGGAPVRDILLRLIKSPDHFRAIAALEGLRLAGGTLAFEELAPVLDDRILWRSAIPLLGGTEDRRAIPWLFRALGSRGELSRAAALVLVALDGVFRDESISSTLGAQERVSLRSLLGRDAAGVAALHLLMRAHDEEALPAALSALAEGSLAEGAVMALRSWGHSAAGPVLEAESPHHSVALELAAELASGDQASEAMVRDSLVRAIEHRDREVAIAGLRGLAHIGTASELESIVRIALSSEPRVSRQAALAVAALATRHSSAAIDVLRGVRLERGTAPLAPVLAQVLGPESSDRLVAGLSVDDVELRAACALALSTIDSPADVVDHLAFSLGDESATVRVAAARSLGRLRGPGAEAPGARVLRKALHARDVAVAMASAEALGVLGDTASLDDLLSLVDMGGPAAGAAVNAVHSIASDRIEVDALLARADSDVVLAAAELLSDGDERWARLLSHATRDVRVRAIASVAHRADAQELLSERLMEETDSGVLEALEEALGELRRQ